MFPKLDVSNIHIKFRYTQNEIVISKTHKFRYNTQLSTSIRVYWKKMENVKEISDAHFIKFLCITLNFR